MRKLSVFAAVVVCAFCLTRSAAAQGYNRPTVSPYLNLLTTDPFGNPGGQPGTYQTLVRPFVEERQAIQANRTDINRLRSRAAGGRVGSPTSGLGTQGRFMNYTHYYTGIRK